MLKSVKGKYSSFPFYLYILLLEAGKGVSIMLGGRQIEKNLKIFPKN